MYHGEVPPIFKNESFLNYFELFCYIFLPIDPARRELQNAIGEIEIDDFFDF